ncbi:NAD(P)-binding protein [Ceraceosorus guamensis]|uniref:NAD(P)-binding protein n=1 Tax=Ceraceosorus guamensis TaxID=1522189 RepID=A0A316VQ02_9BASI|nr:NAD(P)-binding protein [Ceraceosorus guamensis]PWN39410.1 NAD(P)-binding protein [Ceraceosorus guamensis]
MSLPSAPTAAHTRTDIPSTSLFSLAGKQAILTGATRGIGKGCAVALAEAGASCCLVLRPTTSSNADSQTGTHSHSQQQQHEALRDLPTDQGQRHCVVYADLADSHSVKGVFEAALKKDEVRGKVDILVNVGGIQRRNEAVDFAEEDWDEVINVNLKTVWLLSQQAGKHFLSRPGGGKIINFGSLLTFQGGICIPAYASSKGAVGQLTKALSNEWATHSVQVNAIAPGYISTDMTEKLQQDPVRERQISERIPAGRWGTPRDFAGPIVFLASEASAYVTGEILVVDGGWMAR